MALSAADQQEKLNFTVVYNRAEYTSIVLEFLPTVIAERAALKGKKPKPLGLIGRWVGVAMLAVGFAYKKHKMPVNDFCIDAERIVRTNKLGKLDVAWRDIVKIYRLEKGYLVMKKNGGMPLPYRCFSPPQRELMERLLQARERELVVV